MIVKDCLREVGVEAGGELDRGACERKHCGDLRAGSRMGNDEKHVPYASLYLIGQKPVPGEPCTYEHYACVLFPKINYNYLQTTKCRYYAKALVRSISFYL